MPFRAKCARLEPADAATRNRGAWVRRGFYLHDSTKGYSHGCIEAEVRIFPLLRTYARGKRQATMIITVEYVGGRATNGGTLVESFPSPGGCAGRQGVRRHGAYARLAKGRKRAGRGQHGRARSRERRGTYRQ